MPVNFYSSLKDNDSLKNMPPVVISVRKTDKYIVYQKEKMRLDYISGTIYEDETFWRLIMWANPEYYLEFDIPNGAVLRVPFPLNDVLSEVKAFITNNKDK